LIRPKLTSTPFIAGAISSTRRPAARIAGLAAMLVLACCFARSDAQVEAHAHRPLDLAHVIGAWYSASASSPSQVVFDDARTAGVVASVQGMLTTPKIGGFSGPEARVAPLRVETFIHERRVFEKAQPIVRYSTNLPAGKRTTLRASVDGVTWVTERVTMWNDVVVDRQMVTREVVTQAQPGVVLQGTPVTLAELRSTTPYRSIGASLTMVATAYTADSATAYPTGYTATGVLARRGIVAVDPHLIPLGSMVFVPGYGIAIAADTGGAIIGHRIDLCMDAYGEAMNFGRRTVQVYLIKR
jgi:3D (Asp-Asp-Asp) domain-containing protein